MSCSKHSSLMSRRARTGRHASSEGSKASLVELLYMRDCGMLGDTRGQEDFLSRKERSERQQARDRAQMKRVEKEEHMF